jgi:hypothetical protein
MLNLEYPRFPIESLRQFDDKEIAPSKDIVKPQ